MPAYLIADIKGLLDTTDASTRLCAFLSPQMGNKKLAKIYGGGTLGEYARKEFDQFTADQVSVVIDYLLWKLETEGYNPMIEQAL
ncbi:MAG: hypothetical protein GWO23_02935, partial [Gammaproteobacteria bacterium]|nr:hypothetical protein [Gammaproteobacteria bacterium]NIW46311.1 hypothetical protein [Gammaproteobacteria bacterium]